MLTLTQQSGPLTGRTIWVIDLTDKEGSTRTYTFSSKESAVKTAEELMLQYGYGFTDHSEE